MKILRVIQSKTLRDKVPNNEIREVCNVTDVKKFIKRHYQNKHISRMVNKDEMEKKTNLSR